MYVQLSLLFTLLFTTVNAGYTDLNQLHYGGPHVGFFEPDSKVQHQYSFGNDHHEPINYKFNYAVNDHFTGDEKQHNEERHGDVVEGSYSMREADGTYRIVHYKADKHNGFEATVHKTGVPNKYYVGGIKYF
ncbi:adult-specific cuticular protein ACP-20-like [Aethina tumida]|uniref:adult-specific cuticular protein ACP-20-like n=1 Tax=Aethina tumida TaxID=116153 RepID=UPI00096B4627|nr:adult-specific cuticular protein ACP-20-like [Aethina tumida]